MGIDLGILGQVASRGLGGYYRGRNLAEQLRAEREAEEEKRKRQAEEHALRMLILQQEREGNEFEATQRPIEAQRKQEEHEGKLRRDTFETYEALPKLRAPSSLPGEPYESDDDPLEDEERRSRIDENRAQAEYYRARRGQVGKAQPRGPKGPTDAQKRTAWQKDLDAIASAAGGDLGRMHMMINDDPNLFKLRGDRTIRDYHVAAAAAKARKAAKSGSGSDGFAPESGGDELPARHRKFPSESVEAYVRRLKRMGVDSATVLRYGQLQGL